MKFKFYAVAGVAVFTAAVFSSIEVKTNSAAGPAGTSGDPVNNFTCANGVSCHGSNVLDGASVIDIKIGANQGLLQTATASFVPIANTEYVMSVNLTSSSPKHGFCISALTSNNTQAGEFIITAPNQTVKNTANTIEYVSHVNSSSTKIWLFKWKAPATVSGPITFYATANLADGNGNSTGDMIYKRAVSINGSATNVNDFATLNSIQMFPNPASENITLSYNLLSSEYVSANLLSEDGRLVKKLFGEHQNTGALQSVHNIADLPAGKYFVQISAGGKASLKPLVKY